MNDSKQASETLTVTIPIAAADDACAALEAVAYDPREPERYRDQYRASLAALRTAMTEAAAAAVAALDALDVSDRCEARIKAETILLRLVDTDVVAAYGRYVQREEGAADER